LWILDGSLCRGLSRESFLDEKVVKLLRGMNVVVLFMPYTATSFTQACDLPINALAAQPGSRRGLKVVCFAASLSRTNSDSRKNVRPYKVRERGAIALITCTCKCIHQSSKAGRPQTNQHVQGAGQSQHEQRLTCSDGAADIHAQHHEGFNPRKFESCGDCMYVRQSMSSELPVLPHLLYFGYYSFC